MSVAGGYDGRRPHSLISVSSISSSVSSYSSGYGSCLSSGYGATGGTLTTTKESPLEYVMVGCEGILNFHEFFVLAINVTFVFLNVNWPVHHYSRVPLVI